MFLVDQAPKSITKFTASSVQPASYSSDGHVEDNSNFLVAQAVEVFQDDDGPVFGTKLVEGGFDDLLRRSTRSRA